MTKEDRLHQLGFAFAEVLRALNRVIAANGWPSSSVASAVMKMNSFTDSLSGSEATWHDIFETAAKQFKTDERDDIDIQYERIAKSGLQYLMEKTCDDPAAKGRAAQRLDGMLRDIRNLEEIRTSRGGNRPKDPWEAALEERLKKSARKKKRKDSE